MSISAAIAILGPILVEIGAPILKRVLQKEVGGAAGEVGSVVIDTIAGKLGVAPTPEAIADKYQKDPAGTKDVILDVEASQDWIAYLTSAEANRAGLLEREDSKGFFHSGWRPAMSWLVIFLFGWAMFLVPLANAAFKAGIIPPSTADLLQFAGLWLVIYGGGHTAKEIWGKR